MARFFMNALKSFADGYQLANNQCLKSSKSPSITLATVTFSRIPPPGLPNTGRLQKPAEPRLGISGLHSKWSMFLL